MKTHVRITDDSGEMGKVTMGCSETSSVRRAAGLATTGAKKKIRLVQSPFYGILSFKGLLCPEKQRKTFLFLEEIFWIDKFAQPEGLASFEKGDLEGCRRKQVWGVFSSLLWPTRRSLTNGQDIKWENIVGFADFLRMQKWLQCDHKICGLVDTLK